MSAVQWVSFVAGGVIILLLNPLIPVLEARKHLGQLRRDLAAGRKYRCKVSGVVKDKGASSLCPLVGITCGICADPSNTSVDPEVP